MLAEGRKPSGEALRHARIVHRTARAVPLKMPGSDIGIDVHVQSQF